MEKRKISRKSRKQVLSMLEYLRGTEVKCNVTLYYLDEDLEPTMERGVHINPNKIPTDIIKGKREYKIRVKLDCFLPYVFQSYHPFNNECERRGLENTITQYFFTEEQTINHTRKTRLDDILDDTKPITLE